MSDTELLNWMAKHSRCRWKVIGKDGKRVLAYSVDPTWGFADLRTALISAVLLDAEA